MTDPSPCCNSISIVVFPHTNNNNEHLRLTTYELIDYPDTFTTELYLQKAGKIDPVSISKRFAITTFRLRKRICLNLLQCFKNG